MFDPVFANFGLIVTIILGALATVALARVVIAMSAHSWPTVTGRIETLDYEDVDSGEVAGSVPRVMYRYRWADREYVGRRLWFTPRMFVSYSSMTDRLGAVLPEREHPVRVFAPWPRVAVILPGTNMCDVAWLIAVAAATILSAIYWA